MRCLVSICGLPKLITQFFANRMMGCFVDGKLAIPTTWKGWRATPWAFLVKFRSAKFLLSLEGQWTMAGCSLLNSFRQVWRVALIKRHWKRLLHAEYSNFLARSRTISWKVESFLTPLLSFISKGALLGMAVFWIWTCSTRSGIGGSRLVGYSTPQVDDSGVYDSCFTALIGWISPFVNLLNPTGYGPTV